MRRIHRMSAAVAVAVLACTPVSAAAQGQSAPVPRSDDQAKLDWAVARGRLLFALDRAAWVATDDMLERVPRDQQRDLRGYIVDRDAEGYQAIFYADQDGQPVVLYRARIGAAGVASREIFTPGQRPALTPGQQRLARVRAQLAAAAPEMNMCSRNTPNLAIVPPETADGPIDIYVMTPQTDTNVIPFGGHHRLTLDSEGRVTAQRAFTNSCLAMPLSQPGRDRPVALTVTHLLDPIPTEIHVFSAMAARMTVYVGAGGSMWEVTGDHIRHVNRIEPRR